VPLEDGAVERIVEEALSDLPEPIRGWLRSVAILLEDVPDEDVCRQFDPIMPPGELLGCFSGPSMRDRTIELDALPTSDRSWRLLPPSIVLFRRNLERMAHDEEDLVTELRVTVFHEIGHFLGLDEDDLVDRGLD
jgi:predicted Zn-dependent protease with MMP-like domain